MDRQPFVDVWLDATYVHVRENGHVVLMTVVNVAKVRADGHCEVSSWLDVADSENETSWHEFRTSLNERALEGVRLVVMTGDDVRGVMG